MCRCLRRCALDASEPADNHKLHCYLRNNDDGCVVMMMMTAGFRRCRSTLCLSMGPRIRASSRRCRRSATSSLNHMANGDGSWRTPSTRWNYSFPTTRQSLRSLAPTKRPSRPTLCLELWGCCCSSWLDWKSLDLSTSWPPTVREPFQRSGPEYFDSSAAQMHLQRRSHENNGIFKLFLFLFLPRT